MKTHSPLYGVAAILTVAFISLASCSKEKEESISGTSSPSLPFEQTEFTEVIPMTDGSSYAKSTDARLWYLRGNKAVRVVVSDDPSQKLPEFFEITPSLDGGAYVTSLTSTAGLWYFHAEHAERVSEVSSHSASIENSKVSEKGFSHFTSMSVKSAKSLSGRPMIPTILTDAKNRLSDVSQCPPRLHRRTLCGGSTGVLRDWQASLQCLHPHALDHLSLLLLGNLAAPQSHLGIVRACLYRHRHHLQSASAIPFRSWHMAQY